MKKSPPAAYPLGHDKHLLAGPGATGERCLAVAGWRLSMWRPAL
jgi:hypothetical protein